MLESITNTQPFSVLAVTAVVVGVVVRSYYGSTLVTVDLLPMWATLRRAGVPLLNRLQEQAIGASESVDIENNATADEYVCAIDGLSSFEIATKLDGVREVDVPLLAGFKSDPDGRTEAGTIVWYYGDRPFRGAPRWLRHYQVHVTFFTDGDWTFLYAHREANSYRPDLWRDHLMKGASYSASDGVDRTLAAIEDAEIADRIQFGPDEYPREKA